VWVITCSNANPNSIDTEKNSALCIDDSYISDRTILPVSREINRIQRSMVYPRKDHPQDLKDLRMRVLNSLELIS